MISSSIKYLFLTFLITISSLATACCWSDSDEFGKWERSNKLLPFSLLLRQDGSAIIPFSPQIPTKTMIFSNNNRRGSIQEFRVYNMLATHWFFGLLFKEYEIDPGQINELAQKWKGRLLTNVDKALYFAIEISSLPYFLRDVNTFETLGDDLVRELARLGKHPLLPELIN